MERGAWVKDFDIFIKSRSPNRTWYAVCTFVALFYTFSPEICKEERIFRRKYQWRKFEKCGYVTSFLSQSTLRHHQDFMIGNDFKKRGCYTLHRELTEIGRRRDLMQCVISIDEQSTVRSVFDSAFPHIDIPRITTIKPLRYNDILA